MERPVSITVISWFLIVTGGFTLLLLLNEDTWSYWELYEMNPWLGAFNSIIGSGVHIAAGALMLKRHRWGRIIYMVYYPVAVLITWIFFSSLVVSFLWFTILLYLAFIYFLFRSEANDYFDGTLLGIRSLTYKGTPQILE
jgi:hypothetical protein